jgi:serine/threonine-protein phosphatase CPPED1
MKRLILGPLVVLVVGVAVVLSSGVGERLKTFFPREERNPVTHLRWNENDSQFQFAIVSDRTGGHRPEVFAQAVEKLNLMQPAFVLSVGDLIEGGKKPEDKLTAEWKEFDSFVNKLNMPFFYVPGNHDVAAKEAAKVWEDKLGRRYYHFVYRNVLFLILNGDDPPGTTGIGKEQIAWAEKTLKANAEVTWTIVAVHHPLWNANNGAKNGWADVEKGLKGRNYTVFCGHVHRYDKWVRQGMNYYQLATTGGVSKMRGIAYNEFDHFVWVTMKKDGPVLANILLDSVHNESLTKVKTDEPGVSTAKRKTTHPVRGFAYLDGTPMPGAVITYTSDKEPAKGVTAQGVCEADGSFTLSTYKAFDGAPVGEYKVTFIWRTQKGGPNLAPARFASAKDSPLTATIAEGLNEPRFELKK